MSRYSMDMFGAMNRAPTRNSYTAASANVLDTSTMSWTTIGGYMVATLLALFIILLIVHYTIYPIFQLQAGGPGFIRIPFMQSQQVFWDKGSFEDISSNCKVNQSNQAFNWSMSLDISIKNPVLTVQDTELKTLFRLLFNRGGEVKANPTFGDGSISDIFTDTNPYNLAIGLLRDTNDLYISTNTTTGTTTTEQGILLPNVPTQTPFRIGVVVMPTYLEVYFNGKLSKTLKLAGQITSIPSDRPPLLMQALKGNTTNQIARLGNLITWNQAVSPSVMKYASPPLMDPSPEDALGAGAGSCSTSAYNALDDLTGGTLSYLNTQYDRGLAAATEEIRSLAEAAARQSNTTN